MGDAEVHVDEGFADPWLARLYDAECLWHPQDDFYQELDLQAGSVLDVGCGTGTRLVNTHERGHTGELVGVDPAAGMLGVARAKCDRVEWIAGAAQTLDLRRRFDLITMTGHAFQVLLDDDATLAALTAFHDHLSAGGLLAFETRNPAVRAWDGWVADHTGSRIEAPDGEPFEVWVDEPTEVPPDLVSFTSSTRSLRSGELRTTDSTLRFVVPQLLPRELLAHTQFEVKGWFGDWDRSPVGSASPEVIVLARPVRNDAFGRRQEVIAGAIEQSRRRFRRSGSFEAAEIVRQDRDRSSMHPRPAVRARRWRRQVVTGTSRRYRWAMGCGLAC